MKIVQAAKETSNREQGRIHSLDESIIRRWRTNESKLIEAENLPKRMVNNASPMGKKFGNRCRSIGGGRKPKCQEIEQEKFFLYLYRQFALEYIRVWCSQKKIH